MLDLPITNAAELETLSRRVTAEPTEGYVLDPWSGLYLETDVAYKNRLALRELA